MMITRGAAMTRSQPRARLDLHNTSVDFAVASIGGCGFTDLATGRVCRLPHRHVGSCQLHVTRLTPPAATGSPSR